MKGMKYKSSFLNLCYPSNSKKLFQCFPCKFTFFYFNNPLLPLFI